MSANGGIYVMTATGLAAGSLFVKEDWTILSAIAIGLVLGSMATFAMELMRGGLNWKIVLVQILCLGMMGLMALEVQDLLKLSIKRTMIASGFFAFGGVVGIKAYYEKRTGHKLGGGLPIDTGGSIDDGD